MTREEVIKLYQKEREYQERIFGEYKDNPSLNLASFLLFLDNYLNKAKKYYASVWTSELPPWLNATKESVTQETCPAQTYEELIKIMTLAGAALESYASINPEIWRDEGIKQKWI
jgi:hypothetical protein